MAKWLTSHSRRTPNGAALIPTLGTEEVIERTLEQFMREYDGIDYRYKTGEKQSADALKIIAGVLGFEPEKSGLEYDMNLYAGGTGVDDRLAFRTTLTDIKIDTAVKNLGLITPKEAISDPAWGEDFAWLLGDESAASRVQDLSIRFINQNRKPFQSECSEGCRVLFAVESNVNTWAAAWISNDVFNYLSFDQG